MNLFNDMIKNQESLKLNCVNVLASIHGLLASLLSLNTVKMEKFVLEEVYSEQVFPICHVEFHILDEYNY